MLGNLSFCFTGLLFVLHILFWILVVLGLFALVKCLFWPGQKEKDEALELLKKRYARGEISREEFEEKKKDLLSA
ncbi:MAG: SHOCT domain-containing protein [Candidatus Omnitrophota bacterium]